MDPITLILLVLAGLLLIFVEVYLIPGFNVLGVMGFLVLIFAIGYAFSTGGLWGGLLTLLASMTTGALLFYYLFKSGAWDRFVLSGNLRKDETLVLKEGEKRAKYLGKTGEAVSPLRPTGIAEIDGERIEVMTEGEFIAAGSNIRVVAMDRRRFFVRLIDALPESERR